VSRWPTRWGVCSSASQTGSTGVPRYESRSPDDLALARVNLEAADPSGCRTRLRLRDRLVVSERMRCHFLERRLADRLQREINDVLKGFDLQRLSGYL